MPGETALPRGPISRIEWVEQELRRAILGGEYAPGERLLTVQLAETYSVSPTPLREVLHRFAGEGLVEFIPQKGARVSDLTSRDAAELAELRTLLDTALFTSGAANYSAGDRDGLRTASDELCALWRANGHSRAAEVAYRAFLERAGRPSPSLRMRSQASLVRELGARYRLAAAPALSASDLIVWHGQLMRALTAGSEPEIAAAIRLETTGFADAFTRVVEGLGHE